MALHPSLKGFSCLFLQGVLCFFKPLVCGKALYSSQNQKGPFVLMRFTWAWAQARGLSHACVLYLTQIQSSQAACEWWSQGSRVEGQVPLYTQYTDEETEAGRGESSSQGECQDRSQLVGLRDRFSGRKGSGEPGSMLLLPGG